MSDNDALREERDRLLDENAQIRLGGGSAEKDDGASSTVRYLRSKVGLNFSYTPELCLTRSSLLSLDLSL